ncbi:electron transfer flavoprotein subunit beta [Alkalihalobacillus alcalophilus ATCC 27647 = CGMCC 1.3604]|uniref:Electron transfer flavoprotein subunit beta n=1 Tax=Alkalihalobacillus alcalophilus ATCC 27647 = CGMCC 1.3604 TaxID=1218173 RepID=A0A094XCN3_ALKAL|nr:electron transfer flavoprotein subunit beta/FixA family protein [Alkalihalobacillus alcalophilus]KGA96560.1 electron transfer flavoprotein subunit beta [Alkalihalobacillus alcalophilus ATCC 27647 = CGMCC 1.3604]MED1563536.1 electron transfer flavoprotein subunit beta/FixA family protein [Alkalihalobacillus alcalophilus]THG90515.1 electron transfer flavoprotein subunit beta [Alkalihalobacillus alcalophilus ATCC 27647 = CGMCC 1.3604]
MNIFVIMKRTFDTEEKIVIQNGKVDEESAEFIINPYDEYAIEEAIVLRDEHGGEVTVVTVGEEESEKQLRTALAMGADKAVLLNSEDVEEYDPFTTAFILSTYLKEQEYDIILGGNVAVDGGSGQVGPRVAESLGIPQVTTITELSISAGIATVVRDVEGDKETVEVALPILVTAQQGLNEPRYPSLPGIMKAKKKPLEVLDLDDIDLDEDDVLAKTETIEIFLPPEKQAGKRLEGGPAEQVNELVLLLTSEAKVI